MANKSWLENINPFSRMKALQSRLDAVTSEFEDASMYEAKFLDSDPASGSSSGSGGQDYSGIDQQIDTAALQRVYCTESWVYNAVTTIAETVAGLPWKLEKSKKIMKTGLNSVTGAEETIEQRVWTDACTDRLFELFEYPNKYTTKTEFLMLVIIDLLTAGEVFIYLDAAEGVDLSLVDAGTADNNPDSPFGRLRAAMSAEKLVEGMYRIPPPLMKPVPSEDKRSIAGYAMQTDKGSYAFGAAEIIHIKLPNPMDQYRGLSPLIPAFKPVLMDRFTTEHMIRFYKSGARLGGIIETDKSLNKEQLGRFQRTFENNYTGRQNHHRTLILPSGMSYKPIEQNPAETALLEFCKYNRETILATYKVPPIKLGIVDGSSYANAYAQLKTYYNDCIKPKLSFIQDGFNLKSALMPDNHTYRIQFDLSNVEELKEDMKTTAESGKLMLESGMTVNEVRQKVWKLGPTTGGDKSPVIEKMKHPGGLFDHGGLLSATPGSHKDRNAEQTPATDTKPTAGTFTDRVNELVGQLVASGTPLNQAIPKAMEQARLEGFTDEAPAATVEDKSKPEKPCDCDKGKDENCDCDKEKSQSLSQFIADALGKLDENEPVDPAFIEELVNIYNATHLSGPVESKEIADEGDKPSEQVQDSATTASQVEIQDSVLARFGVRKESAVEAWKSFISKSDPLIEKRHSEIRKFFKALQSIIMNRVGANLKSFGLHKARDNEDVDDILSIEAFQDLIKQFTKQVDDALLDAYRLGYDTTLVKFNFGLRNEEALAYLKEFAAKEVKYITDTTRDQMREVLTEAFDAGVPMGEVSKRIREKFTEIDQGRAVTIARTETLSAVSAGRAAKRTEWIAKFPDKKLKKQWISAQDDRVRDSHAEVDGEVVDADASFSNGLAYPRDPSGEPGEIINCRCDDITFAEEDAELIQETLPQEGEDENE